MFANLQQADDALAVAQGLSMVNLAATKPMSKVSNDLYLQMLSADAPDGWFTADDLKDKARKHKQAKKARRAHMKQILE